MRVVRIFCTFVATMKRIIVTGANGQLGAALRSALAYRHDFETLFTDHDNLDITDPEAVKACVGSFRPDYVVNAAAYTAVDKAESEPERCRQINAEAVKGLAEACAVSNAKLVHISTDYVFAGNGTKPYKETDTPSPCNVYGRTKLEGEELVKSLLPDSHAILRTAWMYSHTGKNFVKTMLALASDHEEISVVADQWGTPTYAPVLAQGILALITHKRWQPGTYHFTGNGRTTWYDFARAIFREAGITKVHVNALTSAQYHTAAHRPNYSVLDCSKFSKAISFDIPDWQASLHQFFQDYS